MTISAFPVLERGGDGLELTDPGMTLRDYFAAQAISSYLASFTSVSADRAAAEAYELADAMLKARNV